MSPRDPLDREIGILLATGGLELINRYRGFRAMADLIAEELGEDSASVQSLRMQSERAKETIVNMAKVYDKRATP